MNGYSFKISEDGKVVSRSGWNSPESVFADSILQEAYDSVQVSLLTPKVTLVPSLFFNPGTEAESLSKVVRMDPYDAVDVLSLDEYSAVMPYSLSIGETLSKVVSQIVKTKDGKTSRVLPEMYCILKDLSGVSEYNRIVASFAAPHLHLAISQGKNLLLSNVFEAADFTTAEYFIFLAMKKLQLNPEVSTIHFRTPLSDTEEMSLYRYFKGVELL